MNLATNLVTVLVQVVLVKVVLVQVVVIFRIHFLLQKIVVFVVFIAVVDNFVAYNLHGPQHLPY
ncbi:MAG: hypothetical protein ACFFC7_15340 [Candidatus Hermodarchaeota archaeon]